METLSIVALEKINWSWRTGKMNKKIDRKLRRKLIRKLITKREKIEWISKKDYHTDRRMESENREERNVNIITE